MFESDSAYFPEVSVSAELRNGFYDALLHYSECRKMYSNYKSNNFYPDLGIDS